MHRRIVFFGHAAAIRDLAHELASLDTVIALAHHRDLALKPPGDVLEVEVLNRGADEVMRRAQPHADDRSGELAVSIGRSSALIQRAQRELIESDADEALWEEMESDLRNHGRISVNYVLLMALGGIIAGLGFLGDSISLAIALVGASIIAPGFEPLAKLAQAVVLRQWRICLRAALSSTVGYVVLFGAAFGAVWIIARHEGGDRHGLLRSPFVQGPLTALELPSTVTSACAAVAGVVMVVSLRDLYVVGPLMVLILVAGVALAGAALALGDTAVALGALGRVGVDALLVLVLGAGVFYWKQRRFHHRGPLR